MQNFANIYITFQIRHYWTKQYFSLGKNESQLPHHTPPFLSAHPKATDKRRKFGV
jgi:hypothetical protein